MRKTIGVFAHVDAGKTTLCEAVLYNTGAIHKKGNIENKNTVMDSSEIEKNRGITCFSGAAGFTYNDNQFYLIDTPGHADFLPDTERCMAALDCAVLVVSAVEGIESNTELLWELLSKYGIPVIFFINKCDRDISDSEAVLESIQKNFSKDTYIYQSEEYVEAVAESDDVLMEKFFNAALSHDQTEKRAAELFMQRKLFCVVCGSAALNDGVDKLLECIDVLCKTKYDPDAVFLAEIFKVYREKDKRAMYCHIRGGKLSVRDMLPNGERVTELRLFNSSKTQNVQEAYAGDVVQIYGVNGYNAGDKIGAEKNEPKSVPTLIAKLIYPAEISSADMFSKMKLLEDEEPSLHINYTSETGEISVKVMGQIQLEILKHRIFERFGIDAEFGKCEAVYMETVKQRTVGYGHYEPLRHYSEVKLMIEPAERGSGIAFESKCPLDDLASNYQNLIRTHVFEKQHKGVLIGAPLTDIKITLLMGLSHEKHTEGGDFREAVYRGIRQGLMKAQSMLLEPYCQCRFTVETFFSGRVISDITRMGGQLTDSSNNGQESVIVACLPVAEYNEYQSEFVSFTRGKGRVLSNFCGYRECHNEAEVIERYSYDAQRDVENTADSVFCAHGAGFNVPWHEVEKYIHYKK